MNKTDIWKEAAQQGLNIEGQKKMIPFIELWSMPFTATVGDSLDSLYQKYLRKTESKGISLVAEKSAVTKTEQLVVDLIKDVYTTRKEAQKQVRDRKAKLGRLAELEDLLVQKKTAEASAEDIAKEIAALKEEG